MNKVIVIDWSVFVHKAIFAWPNNKAIPATYTGLNMILGNLARIGIDPDDLIIVAMDGRHSWRKDLIVEYKGNRAEKRKDSGIDFPYWYSEFDKLVARLKTGMDWHFIQIPQIEADDIMAVASRFYTDREVVLLTVDADLEQCWIYPNVKIFSIQTKQWKIKPANFDVYRLQAEKINKETSDNMITEITGQEDYEVRKQCIDLTTLPEWVEEAIRMELENLLDKQLDLNAIPFKTLKEKMAGIYNDKSKIIDYNEQIAKIQKKEDQKKKKKLDAKLKVQKEKEREKKKQEKEKLALVKLENKIKKLEEKQKGESKNDKIRTTG